MNFAFWVVVHGIVDGAFTGLSLHTAYLFVQYREYAQALVPAPGSQNIMMIPLGQSGARCKRGIGSHQES